MAKKEVVKETTSTVKEKKSTKIELSDLLKEIEKKSYEIYQDRIKKGEPGSDVDDWFKAEKSIKSKYGIK